MMERFLLCTDGSPGSQSATAAALWLAHKLGASMRALYVTDIRILEGPLLADISGAVGAAPYPGVLPQIQQMQVNKADALLKGVTELCRQQKISCETFHETGGLVASVLEHEQNADLVVLGQRGEHAQWHREMLGASVERIVRASVKPCLVVPQEFHAPKHLLIAHDGSVESSKALRIGLQLAGKLSLPVTLVTACQREHENEGAKTLQQARELAEERNLKTRAQLIHDNPETAIIRECDESGADFIVMGAYGHTRIREWILGSTTSHVLRNTRVPVLLMRGQ